MFSKPSNATPVAIGETHFLAIGRTTMKPSKKAVALPTSVVLLRAGKVTGAWAEIRNARDQKTGNIISCERHFLKRGQNGFIWTSDMFRSYGSHR